MPGPLCRLRGSLQAPLPALSATLGCQQEKGCGDVGHRDSPMECGWCVAWGHPSACVLVCQGKLAVLGSPYSMKSGWCGAVLKKFGWLTGCGGNTATFLGIGRMRGNGFKLPLYQGGCQDRC